MKPESRVLSPNFIESQRIIKQIKQLIGDMGAEYMAVIESDSSMDSALTDRVNAQLARILEKYQGIFNMLSNGWAKKISTASLVAADQQLRTSLKEVSQEFLLKPMSLQPGTKLNDIFAASTQQSAELFKTIPERFHGKVQNAVMQSIVEGKGLQDLKPFFQKFTTGEKNYAQNRTMDQTRKAFNSLSRERMLQAGITKFKWIATGGGKHPRKYHQHVLNGNVYDFNNPPFIGKMYNQDIYGFPGDLPNCRCKIRGVLVD